MATYVKRTSIIFGLVAVIGFALFYKLGAVPLADPDEPRYAESAREMIERGSYMVPYFNYEPRIKKPVLHYWIICASYMLLGVSEFSARLPSALAALALLVAAFFFHAALLRHCRSRPLLPYYGIKPAVFCARQAAMPDMVLRLLYHRCRCLAFIWAGRQQDRRARNGGMRAFIFFRLLPPGPKALWGFSCLLPLPCSACGSSGICGSSKACVLAWSMPLVLLASLPWYVYIYFFVDQATMAEHVDSGDSRADFRLSSAVILILLYYYFIVLLAGPAALGFSAALGPVPAFPDACAEPAALFSGDLVCCLFLFFLPCAPSKKPQYVVMLSCVFAAWLGTVISDALRAIPGKRDTGLVVSFFAFLAVSIVGAFKGLSWLSKNQPDLIVGGMAGCLPSLCLHLLRSGLLRAAMRAAHLLR